MVDQDRVRTFLLDSINAEMAAGFPRLLRVPSTLTRRILDHIATLDAPARDRLFAILAARTVPSLLPTCRPSLFHVGQHEEDFSRFLTALHSPFDWSYLGIRTLRAWLAAPPAQSPMPPDVAAKVHAIVPVPGRTIRSAMTKALRQQFGATAENDGGGVWLHQGSVNGRPFKLTLDYGSRLAQLRYGLEFNDEPTSLHARQATLEGLLGCGHGDWDFIAARNLDEAVELLCSFIRDLASIPERITAGKLL